MSDLMPVGIVGVGNMGGAIAANLLARGWPLRVCDIDASKCRALEDAGAMGFADPAGAAAQSVVVIVCVVSAAQANDVLFGAKGAAGAMQRGQAVMLCPTMSPQDVQNIAQRLQAFGLEAIDAPMSGGPAKAGDGSMSLMVACEQGVFERQAALIQAMSSKVFRISERVGDGARTKLVNNLAAAVNLLGAAEVLAMAEHMGLPLESTLDVIEQSSGQSWIGSDRMRRAIAGDDAPRAHMALLEKDTRLAVDACLQAGFKGPLGALTRDAFSAASAAGFDRHDDAALLRWLRRQA